MLPAGYTRVEYLKSNGTQLIDTGMKYDFRTDDFEVDYRVTNNGNYFLVASGSTNVGDFWLYNYPNGGTTSIYIYDTSGTQRANGCYQMSSGYSDTYRHKVKIAILTQRQITVDNIEKPTNLLSYGATNYNLYLFGSAQWTAYNAHVEIYGFKWWRSGTLICEMIPCTNPSGTPGMYDTVRNIFYPNAGTGTFITGPTDFGVKFSNAGVLNCTAFLSKSKVVRNMIADGSCSQISGVWAGTNYAGTGDGYRCYRYYRCDTSHMLTQKLPALYTSHKYYLACRYRSTNSTSGCILVRHNSQSSGDIGASNIYLGASGSSWILSSKIFSPPVNTSTNAADICMWAGNGTFDSCKYIMIDLTEAFGSGKEPDKAWCDNNIREHEVFGVSNVTPAVNTSNYSSLFPGSNWEMYDAYAYLSFDSEGLPRDYMYNAISKDSVVEAYVNTNHSITLTASDRYYAFNEIEVPFIYSHRQNLSFDFYWPVAEPLMGQVHAFEAERFNINGGGCKYWKRVSVVANRNTFSSGSYPYRFDLNNQRLRIDFNFTQLSIIDLNSFVTDYNNAYGTSISANALSKHFGDCWAEGRSSPFIHIGDPEATSIEFDSQHNIRANAIEIRPEVDRIKFSSNGKIICKDIVTAIGQ